MYMIKLTGIIVSIFIACNLGYSQNTQSEQEEELLKNLNGSYSIGELYPELQNNNNLQTPNNNVKKSIVLISQTGKENYSKIEATGFDNNSELIQQGNKNYYKLEITGNSNTTKATQVGNENYLEDLILGNNIYHETIQVGHGNAIYNQGLQTTPMIIQQKGVNMKIKIKSIP